MIVTHTNLDSLPSVEKNPDPQYPSRARANKMSVFYYSWIASISIGTLLGAIVSITGLSLGWVLMCVVIVILVVYGGVQYMILHAISPSLARLHEAIQTSTLAPPTQTSLKRTRLDPLSSLHEMIGIMDHRFRLQQTFHQHTKDLHRLLNPRTFGQRLLELLASATPVDAGVLYIQHKGHFERIASLPQGRPWDTPHRLEKHHPLISQAIHSGIQQINDDHVSLLDDTITSSLYSLSFPIASLVAAVAFVRLSVEDDASSWMTLEWVRYQLVPIFDRERLDRRIRELAALDSLTGMLNRRFGLLRLREEFSRARRHQTPLAVVLLDIDHFKRINDTLGHDVGDFALRQITKQIRTALRDSDVCCRYGGEEFLVIIPTTVVSDARLVAERLRHCIASEPLRWLGQQFDVTVSCGVAVWPTLDVTRPEALVTAADAALYQSKQAGRNRVTVCKELPKRASTIRKASHGQPPHLELSAVILPTLDRAKPGSDHR